MLWPPLITASHTIEKRHTQLTQNIGSISTNQSSIITTCTSVESEVKDSSKHMANVYSELRKIAKQNEVQARLSVGDMAKGALEEMIQRTMQQVLEDSNLSERVQSLKPEEIKPQKNTLLEITKDAKESGTHYAKPAK
jgi:septal ring factor EnvC (AmiA/AmiB activator)